jgi:hypothetical protein
MAMASLLFENLKQFAKEAAFSQKNCVYYTKRHVAF